MIQLTMTDKVQWHKELCEKLNDIYAKKNADYGDSFHETWLEEGMAMARIRLSDKLSRFKKLSKSDEQHVKDESIEDTLLDLANYAIMTVLEMHIRDVGLCWVKEDDSEDKHKGLVNTVIPESPFDL